MIEMITVPKELLLRAIDALEATAIMEAGQTQGADLITPDQTQEWSDAQTLRAIVQLETKK